MFKEVIVVEGRDDTRRLKEIYPQIETFETGGSALDDEKLAQIKKLQETRGIIVFTDPDFPGQKIRQAIIDVVPNAMHAYIRKEDARGKNGKGLGVEHAPPLVIKQALAAAMTPIINIEEGIEQNFLVSLDLIGHAKSKEKRETLAKNLGIGYVNGKQLKNRLNMFGITAKQVLDALKE